jgi:hypothetical protein
MIRYPKYITESRLKWLFRSAVMHRLLMENDECPARAKTHAFKCGKRLGMMLCNKTVWWRKVSIQDEIYNETRRLYTLLKEPKEVSHES